MTSGEWVLLVGPRQHGKSSALVRLYARLADQGYVVSFLDLQRYAGGHDSYPDFLSWVAYRIATEVGGEYVEPVDQARDDLESWLAAQLPPEYANVAILIDEVSGVPPPFRERFFSQLRAIFNSRPLTPPESLANRTVLAFAGTFRPERMIESDNSPFNISQWQFSDDLSADDVESIASIGLGDSGNFGRRAFAATRGHPYLVQALLAAVQRADDEEAREKAFEATLEGIRNGTDRHVPDLMRMVTGDEELLDLARRLLTEEVPYDSVNDPDHEFAVISGIGAERAGRLEIRNEIYREALERAPAPAEAGAQLPAEGPPEGTEYDVVLVTATEVETAAVQEVFSEGQTFHGATNTYRDLGSYGGARVALARSAAIGAGGQGGATLTINDAIGELGVTSVVLVGIAFGVDPGRQRIGDVLVASRIVDYELQRLGTDEEGRLAVRLRGTNEETSARLIARFQNAAGEFDGRVEEGVMLSGDKLIDNIDFRDALRTAYPDARGGEMEALGASAAGGRAGSDWIVVKAYCDWADGTKGRNQAYRQRTAAERAAQFVRVAIELGGFARET